MKYRKRPVVIEAFQLTEEGYENLDTWPQWLRDAFSKPRDFPCSIYASWRMSFGSRVPKLIVHTLEGAHVASLGEPCSPGDWIIQGVKGELYSCKPDIFEMTYEPVAEESP